MRIKVMPLNDRSLRRMTMDEFNEMIDESENAIAQGRTITQSELEKRIADW